VVNKLLERAYGATDAGLKRQRAGRVSCPRNSGARWHPESGIL
jgi:hypothetical protein